MELRSCEGGRELDPWITRQRLAWTPCGRHRGSPDRQGPWQRPRLSRSLSCLAAVSERVPSARQEDLRPVALDAILIRTRTRHRPRSDARMERADWFSSRLTATGADGAP